MGIYINKGYTMKKRKLFIGNLDFSVTEKKLRDFLSPHGTVMNVKVMEGKGYAFVEMGSEEQARQIQQNLSERIFEGRKLLIDGVPGTRRPERTPDRNQPDPRGRGQNSGQGRRPGPGSSSEGRKPPRPEWKSQNSPKEEQRYAKPVRKGTESDTRPRTSPNQNPPRTTYQKKIEEPRPKPGSDGRSFVSGDHGKRAEPERPGKPSTPKPPQHKRSKVPSWVIKKRSSGNKP